MKTKKANKRKIFAHIIMIIILFLWGLEYIFVKDILIFTETFTIVFIRYGIGALLIFFVKIIIDKNIKIKKKDILVIFASVVIGQLMYMYFQYEAMEYMSASIITIMLAFLPVVSVVTERILYKEKITLKILLFMVLVILGIILIMGIDIKMILNGRFLGYLFCIIAVFAWNNYNYFTSALTRDYSGTTVTFYQLLCAVLIIAPYALQNFPSQEKFTNIVIIEFLYLGIIGAGLAYFGYIYVIGVLGPTISAIYVNFLPVTTAFFGVIILGENLKMIQIFAAAIIILFGTLIIKERGMKQIPMLDKRKSSDILGN